ncbi:hypothetical protein ACFYXD_35995 [Streptomyces platensis]|uniref:hypothetical protein n=1 Tax=Streptomyces platensis TaxID=58346 RepID=UPI0036B0C8F1
MTLDLRVAAPAQRTELIRPQQVRAALRARAFAVSWRPIGEAAFVRGYALTATAPGDPQLNAAVAGTPRHCFSPPS